VQSRPDHCVLPNIVFDYLNYRELELSNHCYFADNASAINALASVLKLLRDGCDGC
jgi:hypothetical protein